MKHELPALPYALDALEPVMSKETLEYHYGKHEAAYLNNLNNLIVGTPFESMELADIVRKAEGPIFNNAAQAWNHLFFFNQFAHRPKQLSAGELADAIRTSFGSLDELKAQFNKAGGSLFGSGWVWLVAMPDGSLKIVQTGNAGTPIKDGGYPILTCDVWEHAYYIDYRNRRPDFLNKFWDVVDWTVIEERYAKR